MGRLFTGSGTLTQNPETTLATFEEGMVYSPEGTFGTGHRVLLCYDGGRISRTAPSVFGSYPEILARCDQFGRIQSADGTRLGSCEEGKVKDRDGRVIAYYEGDLYGAAAAACAVFFGVGGPAKEDRMTDPIKTPSHEAAGGQTDEGSALRLILSIVGMGVLWTGKLLWRLLKTSYFWGPYVSALLLSAVISAPAALFIPLLFLLLYLLLHTVLLVKCKRRQGKNRYLPAIISFLLYLASFFLFGAPAVVYQIVWLVQENRKKQTGGNRT